MQGKRLEGEGPFMFFLRNVAMAAVAGSTGELVTIPLDTAKVRLQIQKTAPGETPRYKGNFGTIAKVASEEGPLALWNGIIPGLQRQVINCGLRVGLYLPVRDAITGPLAPG